MTLDVIITSTCRKTIFKTISSFLEKMKFDGKFRFIVNIDLLKKNKRNLDFILTKLDLLNIKDINIEFTPNHAKAINYLYSKVNTEYFFNLEDDWIFLKEINLNKIINLMSKNQIYNIRLPKEKIINFNYSLIKKYKSLGLEHLIIGPTVKYDEVYLTKTKIWSLNPSIVKSEIAKSFLNIPIQFNPENFITFKLLSNNIKNGLFILGKPGDSAICHDIGRKNPFINKFIKIFNILLNPKLLSKTRRIEAEERYRGKRIY